MNLKVCLAEVGLSENKLLEIKKDVEKSLNKVKSGEMELSDWVGLPLQSKEEEITSIVSVANKIRETSEIMVVIGIGGSYIGAKAVIEALKHMVSEKTRVVFAGNNLSATYHEKLISEIEGKDISLCVISKSGSTTETKVAFSIFSKIMTEKYGDKAAERIYVITDAVDGPLRKDVEEKGYKSFEIPKGIPGRYSLLTAVGLLPIAVAGINVSELLRGAYDIATISEGREICDYAAARYLMLQSGKDIEVIEYYEPQLEYFAEWLKQLFGESEGKEGKGLFPTSLSLSADLHSLGQYLQEGKQLFFETVFSIKKPPKDIILPEMDGDPLGKRSLNSINDAAMKGVIAAHRKIGVPIIKIEIPELTPYYLGQLIYYLEMTCAITGVLMGVNPFNQPGVEQYKDEMKKELKKENDTDREERIFEKSFDLHSSIDCSTDSSTNWS